MADMGNKRTRNQTMELGKLMAACLVVLIHAPFEGRLGALVTLIARFAVPFFFAVSGYYSYGIDAGRIKKRIGNLVWLHLFTAVLCAVMFCITTPFLGGTGEDISWFLRKTIWPDCKEIFQWLLLQINPYGGHLWYISALLLCYVVLLTYVRFWEEGKQDNRPLYFASFVLFAIYFAMSNLLAAEGTVVPFKAYRNGWLMGIPMFSLGMFLHEYEQRLADRYHLTSLKMFLLAAAGGLLTVLQFFAGFSSEIPLGMYLAVPMAILFLARNPEIPGLAPWAQAVLSRCGVVSTGVYILHIAVIDVYNVFLKAEVSRILGAREPVCMPLIVVVMTLAVSVLWERADWLLKKRK